MRADKHGTAAWRPTLEGVTRPRSRRVRHGSSADWGLVAATPPARGPSTPRVRRCRPREEVAMAVQDDPKFQHLVASFVDECLQRGVRLDRKAAEGVLTSQVSLYSARAHA